jgi:hypothetical protein
LKISTDETHALPEAVAGNSRAMLGACPRDAGAPLNVRGADCWFVRYIPPVAFEAVLQEALKMPAEERAGLVERLFDDAGRRR